MELKYPREPGGPQQASFYNEEGTRFNIALPIVVLVALFIVNSSAVEYWYRLFKKEVLWFYIDLLFHFIL